MNINKSPSIAITVLSGVLLVMLLIILSKPIGRAAGPWYVAPSGDDGNNCLSPTAACATINQAIAKAASGDTIYVASGTYTGTGNEVVLLNKNITLSGGWESTFTSQEEHSIIDGQTVRQGIVVASGLTVLIERFIIQNGYSDGFCGGGMIYGTAPSEEVGRLTLYLSAVSNNRHKWGGGGICISSGDMTLDSSSVTHNIVTDDGGFDGGGILIYDGTLKLNNSTVSGNQSPQGGGIRVDWQSVLTMTNSTISSNMSSWIGGVQNEGTATLQNTIIANNINILPPPFNFPDCQGSFSSAGYNLIGDTTGCSISSGPGDLLNVYPGILSLRGLPAYHPLLPKSPAIDAGNPAGCTDHEGSLLLSDQRGVTRPLDGDWNGSTVCDIGSYEFDPEDPLILSYLPIIAHNFCAPILADDFKDPGSGWPVEDTGNVLYEYLSGEYRILLRNTDWFAAVRSGIQMVNYVVAVDVRNASNTNGTYGLIFGLSSDWTQFYTFEIDRDSFYSVWRFANSSGWTELASGYSPHIKGGYFINRLKIVRDGSSLEAYANGQLLAKINDDKYIGMRYIGLTSSSYDQPDVDARFDDFAIYPLLCGADNITFSEDNAVLWEPAYTSASRNITKSGGQTDRN